MNLMTSFRKKIFGEAPAMITEPLVREALSKVYDPDLHRDIVSLGFVKKIDINGSQIAVTINLTTPACPVKEQLQKECEAVIKEIPGVSSVQVTMTAAQTTSPKPTPQSTTIPGLSQVRHIIAVASGKGGVAKSTTSVNIAYALAQLGAKVGLLDADVYGPSLPQMLKSVPYETTAESKDQRIVPPIAAGLKVVSIGMFAQESRASILRGPMAGGVVKQFLTQVDWGDLDYLIIDCPPGTGDIQLTISQTVALTGAVIVTTPQEVSLIDVRKCLDMFKTLKVPILGVIETLSYFVCDQCDKKHLIFRSGGADKLCREYGISRLGDIPIDPSLVTNCDSGVPQILKSPTSPSGSAYQEATKKLVRCVSIIEGAQSGTISKINDFELHWTTMDPPRSPRHEYSENQVTPKQDDQVGLLIQEIKQFDNETLEIMWTSGEKSLLNVVSIRQSCPCAQCIDEWSGKKIVDIQSIKKDVRPIKVKSVGSYAVQFWFNDGHSTGIYTYNLLHNLGGKVL